MDELPRERLRVVCDEAFATNFGSDHARIALRRADAQGTRVCDDGVWAVSYTHLDVYKRQTQRIGII